MAIHSTKPQGSFKEPPLGKAGEFGNVTVKTPTAPPVGSVTVKEPAAAPVGSVTVKPSKPSGFGKVIQKSRKFGIDPAAIRNNNSKMVAKPGAQQQAAEPPVTHVSGVQIPPSLHQHFKAGQAVPYNHPAREEAAKFVTNVWRRDEAEGRRMSQKLLGIGEGGKIIDPNVKPGYATIKSEQLFKRSKIKKIDAGGTSRVPAPPRDDTSGPSMQDRGRQVQQALSGGLPEKTGFANVAQELGSIFGKDEKPPSAPAAPPLPDAPKPAAYNPRTERPNQRARVADVKAKMTAAGGDHKVSLSTSNSKLAKDGVASFNLVPIETCPGAGSCAKYCYADTGSYLRFHNTTMPPRVSNWLASQKDDFVPKMIDMLHQAKKVKGKKAIKAVRIHDSGDFYSPQYIDKWHQIASAHPDMKFYAYTKSHHPKLRERLNELEKLPNVNIVQSFGSKYDHLIDPSKPHCVVFPSKETMDKAGYADAMETDLTASDKNNKKVGLYIHGQYDKSYPGLAEHIKDNPQVKKEIEDTLQANGGKIE